MTKNGSASDKATGSNGMPTRSETGTDRTKAKTDEVNVVVAGVPEVSSRESRVIGEGEFRGNGASRKRKRQKTQRDNVGREKNGEKNVSRRQ